MPVAMPICENTELLHITAGKERFRLGLSNEGRLKHVFVTSVAVKRKHVCKLDVSQRGKRLFVRVSAVHLIESAYAALRFILTSNLASLYLVLDAMRPMLKSYPQFPISSPVRYKYLMSP